MDLACPMFNPRYWKRGDIYTNSYDIALAIEGGWQKYTYEKVGYQTIFRGRLSYAPDFKSPIFLLQFLVTLTQLLPLKYQQELMESLILSKTIRVVLE